jgi:hypothetical protein
MAAACMGMAVGIGSSTGRAEGMMIRHGMRGVYGGRRKEEEQRTCRGHPKSRSCTRWGWDREGGSWRPGTGRRRRRHALPGGPGVGLTDQAFRSGLKWPFVYAYCTGYCKDHWLNACWLAPCGILEWCRLKWSFVMPIGNLERQGLG